MLFIAFTKPKNERRILTLLISVILVLTSSFFLGSCQKPAPPISLETLLKDPLRKLSWWQNHLKTEDFNEIPLKNKIQVAPKEVLIYLKHLNQATGYTSIPETIELSQELQMSLNKALLEIPPQAQKFLNQNIVGVYLLRGLGSSGLVESILDSTGKSVAGFLCLDAEYLSQNANAWYTWRENTPFWGEKGFSLKGKLEPDSSDNLTGSLRFILMHEIAHVSAMNSSIHPDWEQADSLHNIAEFDYPPFSWTQNTVPGKIGKEKNLINKGKIVSKQEEVFTLRQKIKYYQTPDLAISQFPEIYDQLSKTSHPTLYGALTVYEDFAESFASYIHMRKLHKPMVLQLYKDDSLIYSWSPNWDAPFMQKKVDYLENLIFNK